MGRSITALLCASLLIVSVLAVFNLAYPYYSGEVIRRTVMTDELLELERQGKIEAPGVQFFANTPKPTHIATRTFGKVPDEWDWRLHAKLPSNVMTQRAPNWCGACFAFSTVHSISSAYSIQYPKQFTDTILSVQEILNCGNAMGFGYIGCSGSQIELVFAYIEKYGVVDSTCNPYLGVERAFTLLGDDCWKKQCRSCMSDGTCKLTTGKKWGISGWGLVKGEEEMKHQIYTGGPIACYIQTHNSAYADYTSGIMSDPTVWTDPLDITHVVTLIAYGEENGVPYWTAQNWAQTTWGENGTFRIFRGNNTMNIESRCGYGIPDPDWVPPA